MPSKMMPFRSMSQAFDAGMCRCIGRNLFEEVQTARENGLNGHEYLANRTGVSISTVKKWLAFDLREKFVYPTDQFSNANFANVLRSFAGLNTLISEQQGARLVLAGFQYCFWNHNWVNGNRRAKVPNCGELVILLTCWSEARGETSEWERNPSSASPLSNDRKQEIISLASGAIKGLGVQGLLTDCLPGSVNVSKERLLPIRFNLNTIEATVVEHGGVFFEIVDMLQKEDNQQATLVLKMPGTLK